MNPYGFEHGPEVVTISAAEGIHYVPYDAEMQKKLPYYGGTYEVCNIPFTDFQIRYQPEQIRIVNSKRILENTAFLCRKDNDHFLILPSVYEKLDLDDWLLAHLFFIVSHPFPFSGQRAGAGKGSAHPPGAKIPSGPPHRWHFS